MLDALFLSKSALLRLETGRVQQNLAIIAFLEQLTQDQTTDGTKEPGSAYVDPAAPIASCVHRSEPVDPLITS